MPDGEGPATQRDVVAVGPDGGVDSVEVEPGHQASIGAGPPGLGDHLRAQVAAIDRAVFGGLQLDPHQTGATRRVQDLDVAGPPAARGVVGSGQ